MLCPSCGANLTVPHVMSEMPAQAALNPDEGLPPVLPPPPGTQRTSKLAIASLVCSLTCVGWLPGVIFGHVARYLIRHDPRLSGKGLATAGLVIGYGGVLLCLGSAVLIPILVREKIRHEFPTAQVSILTNSPVYQPAAPQMDTNDNEQPQQPSASGWTLDVKDATIPENPVSGAIHGADFQLKRVLYRNGNLRFTSSDGQESLIIHNVGDSIANTGLEVQTTSVDNAPTIEIGWKDSDEDKTQTFQGGYAMELKFDAAKGRRIPGQIYLCLPDDSKSYIAGTFTVTLAKPKPKPKPAQ